MKQIIKDIWANKTTRLLIVWTIGLLLLITIILATRWDVESQRISFRNQALANQETASGAIAQIKPQLMEALQELASSEECLQANSHTGTAVDCSTISKPKVEIIVSTGSNSLPTENNNQTREQIIMQRICDVKLNWKQSPLCNNWELFNSWVAIFKDHWVPYDIAFGIMYAESHIGINYAWDCNETRNNWGGLKRKIGEDGKAVKDQVIPNWPNKKCRLYKFDSVTDYFHSKAHTLQKYSACFKKDKPIACISKSYLTWDKKGWTARVGKISY